ncbi:MAG TPA: SurA N-terminal domain-containing protein [Candidatus Kapabacteria bacterium]
MFLLFSALLCVSAVWSSPLDSVKKPRKYKSLDTVGIVNKIPIYYGDYRDMLKQTIRDNQSDSVVTDTAFARYVNMTWDKIVLDILIEEEIEKRKLALTEEQVISRLLAEPPDELRGQFVNTIGAFDRETCAKYLRNPQPDLSRTRYVEYYRTKYEGERFYASIGKKGANSEERMKAFTDWYQKKLTNAQIIDKRTSFGFY